ncbi:MAG: polysaccharide deacetylase family protein [Treponemataceae bacterium]|nr:MAG: polysaccharide deacetylase family protein [Treponemataceae bacterium]
MRIIRAALFLTVILCAASVVTAPLYAGTAFINPQIRQNGDILFSLLPGNIGLADGGMRYTSLALANVSANAQGLFAAHPVLLTCFPGKLELLQDGSVLRISNRYGAARYSFTSKKIAPLPLTELPLYPARFAETAVSPDGKWVCSIKKTSAAHGSLVVRNTSENTGQNDIVLADNVDFSFDSVPVKWSPDSSVLVYERANKLFFLRVSDIERKTILDEQYRAIGEGFISAVNWASEKNLVYIYKDIIYAIPAKELYTRAIYSSFVGIGAVLGRLPWNFNSASDSFWVNASMSTVILLQDKRTIFSIDLAEKTADKGFVSVLSSFTAAVVPGGTMSAKVFWDSEAKPVIWFETADGGALYKLNGAAFIKIYNSDFVQYPSLSPNAKNLAFIANGAVIVFNLDWNAVAARLYGDTAVSMVWKTDEQLIVGGISMIRLWSIDTNTAEFVHFSSTAGEYGWDEVSGKICVKTVQGSFVYENERWTRLERDAFLAVPELANGYYRVFIGESPNENFDNALFIRTLTGAMETRALFPDSAAKPAPRGKVALVFDALDDASGVGKILRALFAYNLRATFFVNGEFIRRYPRQLKEILDAGHSCASMFFSAADLSASGFKIDADFIKRGLAHNEDEFLSATGKELSLLWHTPGYVASDTIKKAGQDAGYTWVNKGLAPPDRVTLEAASAQNIPYYSASDMIETIYRVLKASALPFGAPRDIIIPVSVGIANGTRNDYLYEKLDILIYAILEAGYDIVPVDTF